MQEWKDGRLILRDENGEVILSVTFVAAPEKVIPKITGPATQGSAAPGFATNLRGDG
jgi:hypothetical protein